jgi:hypothetical protein
MTITNYALPSMDEFSLYSKVFMPHIFALRFTAADLDANDSISFPVLNGLIVHDVGLLVETAFDVATVVDVGDADDPDGYIDADGPDVDPTATGVFFSGGGPNALAQGKHYPAGGVITVAFDDTPTVGAGILLVTAVGFEKDWRELASENFGS